MMDLFTWLIEPLQNYGFMRVGIVTAAVVGVTCAVLSCLLVVRGQALLGDAISHAVLFGVVVGYLLGGNAGVQIGALLVAIASGMAIVYVARNAPFQADTAMGVVFTVLFALGLALFAVFQPRNIDVFHVLFGNILGVRVSDLWFTATVGVIVVVVIAGALRAFTFWSFDADGAAAAGMPIGRMEYLFTALLSAAIVGALRTVGIILVVALLIIPGAAASFLTVRLSTMMMVAAAIGVGSGVGGLYVSYYANVPSGAAIVLLAGAVFFAVFLFAPRGVLGRRLAQQRNVSDKLRDDVK